jgi:hypothetical protein
MVCVKGTVRHYSPENLYFRAATELRHLIAGISREKGFIMVE